MNLVLASSFEGLLEGLWIMGGIVAASACLLWVALRKRTAWTIPILIVNGLMLWPSTTVAYYLLCDLGQGGVGWKALVCFFTLATVSQAVLVVIGIGRLLRGMSRR
jgi:hypothetical protein